MKRLEDTKTPIYVETPMGKLMITNSVDTTYPGIDVELLVCDDNNKEFTNPRVLFEQNFSGELRALMWQSSDEEDYTDDIEFKNSLLPYSSDEIFIPSLGPDVKLVANVREGCMTASVNTLVPGMTTVTATMHHFNYNATAEFKPFVEVVLLHDTNTMKVFTWECDDRSDMKCFEFGNCKAG